MRKILVKLLMLILLAIINFAHSFEYKDSKAIAYKAPSIMKLSKEFIVEIDEEFVDVIINSAPKNIPNENIPKNIKNIKKTVDQTTFIHFHHKGKVEVKIKKLNGPIINYSVAPKAFNIKTEHINNTIKLTLEEKKFAIIEINFFSKIIILNDDIKDESQEILDKKKYVNVGNLNINEFDNTQIIQNSINKLNTNGGGVIYFPPGIYRTGTIDLLSNVTMHFEKGSILIPTKNIKSFPILGKSKPRKITLIRSLNQKNIKITGSGIINANFDNEGLDMDIQISAIRIAGGSKFEISDLIITGHTYWAIIIGNSTVGIIDNIKILGNEYQYENDGVVICNSNYIIVSNGFVFTGDDAYSTKSYQPSKEFITYPNDNLRADDTHDITFKNNLIYSNQMAYKIGSSVNKPQYNISFENSFIVQSKGIGVVYEYGASYIRNVFFRNLSVDKTYSELNNKQNNIFTKISSLDNENIPKGEIKSLYFSNIEFAGIGINGVIDMGYSPAKGRYSLIDCNKNNGGWISYIFFENITIDGNNISNLINNNIKCIEELIINP